MQYKYNENKILGDEKKYIELKIKKAVPKLNLDCLRTQN
ncbi:hypothetical protein DESAMIL20_1477 [Desulfurella amilsii]|uniref:Uncharacterized protein n=1 Tax=Desulfurella amilsii TaxID=1562698 RepID=A0A1X4XWM9_9BACT|nr:hypothetical protein DESAMIL20_1477 [Desulfurella amilsii]